MFLVNIGDMQYTAATMEVGGVFEDKTGFLRLKNSAGTTIANWQFLDSLGGFIFSTEVVQPLTGASLSATAAVDTALSVDISHPIATQQELSCTYQWQISTDGSTWADIEDAVEETYTPVADDGTKFIRVQVTAYGSVVGHVYSDKSKAVAQALKSVTLSKTAQVGVAITIQLEYSAAPIEPTLTYQWEISATGTSGWAEIENATNATYEPIADDVGKFVRVNVAASGTAIGLVASDASTVILAAGE